MRIIVLDMLMRFLCFIIAVGNVSCEVPSNSLTVKEYERMPPLYKLNNFDQCIELADGSPAIYCVVKSAIKPDESVESWNLIKNFSSNAQLNYQHDLLERGICISWCQHLLKEFDNSTSDNIYQEKFIGDRKITLPAEYYERSLEDRRKFNQIVNKCVNLELMKDFNLTAYSEIEFCMSSERELKFGPLDYTFIIVVGLLILLICASTIYDVIPRSAKRDDTFAIVDPEKKSELLVSFSLWRNTSRLLAMETTPLGKELQVLNGYRVVISAIVIASHCILVTYVMPMENTYDAEKNYFSFLIAGMDLMRFCFTLTALLITVIFIDDLEKGKEVLTFRYVWKGIIDRYIRIVPVYAFVILFRSTPLVLHLDNGPFWNKFARASAGACSKNWWVNLLFINNYVNISDTCMPEAWYLAVDFQLFILARFIRILIWKYPITNKLVLGTGIATSYLTLGIVHYYNQLDGALVISLSNVHSLINLQIYDNNFAQGYLPTHIHLGDAFIGILGAIIYHRLKKNNVDLKEYKSFSILWHLFIPIVMGFVAFSLIFYQVDVEKPSWWMAVVSTFVRHLWPWYFIVIFLGLVHRVNSYLTEVTLLSLLQPLAKVSYCVYISHFSVISGLLLYGMRAPLHSSIEGTIILFLKTMPIAYTLGFILYLCIEMPTASVYKYFNTPSPRKVERTQC